MSQENGNMGSSQVNEPSENEISPSEKPLVVVSPAHSTSEPDGLDRSSCSTERIAWADLTRITDPKKIRLLQNDLVDWLDLCLEDHESEIKKLNLRIEELEGENKELKNLLKRQGQKPKRKRPKKNKWLEAQLRMQEAQQIELKNLTMENEDLSAKLAALDLKTENAYKLIADYSFEATRFHEGVSALQERTTKMRTLTDLQNLAMKDRPGNSASSSLISLV